MEFCHSCPFVMFLMLTVNQFVGCGDGSLEQQTQDRLVF